MKEKTRCDRWMTGLGHCRANNEEEPCAEDSGAYFHLIPRSSYANCKVSRVTGNKGSGRCVTNEMHEKENSFTKFIASRNFVVSTYSTLFQEGSVLIGRGGKST